MELSTSSAFTRVRRSHNYAHADLRHLKSRLWESRLTPAICIWLLPPDTEITKHMQSCVADIQNKCFEVFYGLPATLQLLKPLLPALGEQL
jgi:hypothetical protein